MINVRAVTSADAPEWLRMRRELWPEYGANYHESEVDAYFAGQLKMPLEVLIAIDENGKAIGFAELNIRAYADDCLTDRVAYLEGWYVDGHARRRGVGRALIDAAERWAVAQGCTEFASDALLDNEVSAEAHKALGFEETAQIRLFRKDLAPAPLPRYDKSDTGHQRHS